MERPYQDERASTQARIARLEEENARLRAEGFHVLDWIGFVVSALCTVWMAYFALVARPAFQAMFADFGGQLPALTRFVLRPYVPPLLDVVPAGLLVAAVASRAPLDVRRYLVVGAFVIVTVVTALCVAAMYLPIWQVAGQIRTE